MSGPAKISAKPTASAMPGAQQPRPARAARVDGAVADPPGDRVEHDVPGLRQEARSARPPARRSRGCRSGRAAASGPARCRRRRSRPSRSRSRCGRRRGSPGSGRGHASRRSRSGVRVGADAAPGRPSSPDACEPRLRAADAGAASRQPSSWAPRPSSAAFFAGGRASRGRRPRRGPLVDPLVHAPARCCPRAARPVSMPRWPPGTISKRTSADPVSSGTTALTAGDRRDPVGGAAEDQHRGRDVGQLGWSGRRARSAPPTSALPFTNRW